MAIILEGRMLATGDEMYSYSAQSWGVVTEIDKDGIHLCFEPFNTPTDSFTSEPIRHIFRYDMSEQAMREHGRDLFWDVVTITPPPPPKRKVKKWQWLRRAPGACQLSLTYFPFATVDEVLRKLGDDLEIIGPCLESEIEEE